MTDITELAQREKFEAWWEREYKYLESSKYTDAVPHIKYGFWMAYQAGGAELVEALEKAQQRITQLESRTVKLPKAMRIEGGAYCSAHAYYDSNGDYYDRADVVEMLVAEGIKVEAE
ncbi:hypothetical protein I6F39_12615 [Klebsiella michiganensis]|uniref:hypothetical protein n=1 Tax=Klebsiella michiganensis TaxID=1134687 RepID=UPI0018D28C26|nr:hypothetical protein [Klebsiella michiganensis]QPQ13482.1 hypothetical protein I6F39_12615 [Klebsiella michiganensis]UPI89682.1 hypothetical protein MMY93_12635 [Klebsiella michiganensis]HDX8823702.1 hypothetical protein [Klebsiella michiganensis]